MKQIHICDVTMKQGGLSLSFKEKIELAKLLDRLGVSVIELEGVSKSRIDTLRIKSICTAVKDCVVAVPVTLDRENTDRVWSALSVARKPRLQVCGAVSAVQMEYIHKKKPDAMCEAVGNTIAYCRTLCPDVEFVAEDATRSDPAFLDLILNCAIDSGASVITLCDSAGVCMPDELGSFLDGLIARVPRLRQITLGIACSDRLAMADACAITAIQHGASEVKAAGYASGLSSLEHVARILAERGPAMDISCGIHVTQLSRVMQQILWMCESDRSQHSPFDHGVQPDDASMVLSAHDSPEAVLDVVSRLGYDLSDEDGLKVYDAFCAIAEKKEHVSAKEMDAIVASAAMQVPPTYVLDTYVITAGNTISATAHLRLKKNDRLLEGICIGDGPIDAAFLAIESIVGQHYELDDFQIQAVTEGREAMGQTVVKLRSGGRLYSGKGISTDIVGASIHAYLSALNKIAYEETDV